LFEPLPLPWFRSHSTLKSHVATLGSSQVECVTLTPIRQAKSSAPTFTFTSNYCFSKTVHIVRTAQVPPVQSLAYNKLKVFQSKAVAEEITLGQGTVTRGHLLIDTLEAWTVSDDTFDAQPQTFSEIVFTPGSMEGGPETKFVEKGAPVYPPVARASHTSGAVFMSAEIGTDGHTSNVEIVASDSPLLSEAAVDAVRKWIYEPPRLDNKPVRMDTLITINFYFGN
jgi:TonB family protein